MSKFIKILLGLGLVFNFSQAAQILKIGTEGTYSPFTFHKDGKLVGYDVEVISEAARRAGYKPKFFETDWPAMFAGLNNKRFDVIANQVGGENKKREKIYLLSIPYTYTSAAIAVKTKNSNITSLKDFKGKKIAQGLGSNYYEVAKSNGAKIIIVDNLAPALKAISQGRADATINDKLAILNYLNVTGDKNIKIAFETNPTYSVFIYRKDSERIKNKIDEALKEMKEDGTLSEISKKYFGVDVSEF